MVNPLCCQRVTVYHRTRDGVQRRVIDGCYYDWKVVRQPTLEGVQEETVFLLILPPGERIEPGDRVYDGTGPEQVDWQSFLPATVPGLSQTAWVRPCYIGSSLHHTEAGNQ